MKGLGNETGFGLTLNYRGPMLCISERAPAGGVLRIRARTM